jgi:hypothetical protein
LPPALAGGIRKQYPLALAKKNIILAKALLILKNFIPPAKAGGY